MTIKWWYCIYTYVCVYIYVWAECLRPHVLWHVRYCPVVKQETMRLHSDNNMKRWLNGGIIVSWWMDFCRVINACATKEVWLVVLFNELRRWSEECPDLCPCPKKIKIKNLSHLGNRGSVPAVSAPRREYIVVKLHILVEYTPRWHRYDTSVDRGWSPGLTVSLSMLLKFFFRSSSTTVSGQGSRGKLQCPWINTPRQTSVNDGVDGGGGVIVMSATCEICRFYFVLVLKQASSTHSTYKNPQRWHHRGEHGQSALHNWRLESLTFEINKLKIFIFYKYI